MIADYLISIRNHCDVKKNLLALKDAMKEKYLAGDFDFGFSDEEEALDILISLLNDEDPKIRKNACICLGFLENDASAQALIEAYKREETNYNKAEYLLSISRLEHSDYIDYFRERFDELKKLPVTEENKKHYSEELHALDNILRLNGAFVHTFTGDNITSEAVLLTNRNFKNVTFDSLAGVPRKEFNAGIKVKTNDFKKVMTVRTFSEILFVPDKASECSKDPLTAARELASAGLADYIFERHKAQDGQFNFRVDFKTADVKQKAVFEKKFALKFEYLTGWNLLNSTGDYDVELRIIEGESSCKVLVKFMTFKDERFSYRKRTISAGMKPSLAALLCKLASPYMKNNASVLDPFCGSAVLLAERNFCNSYRIGYGVDIYGAAVEAARENLKQAGILQKSELIMKDFNEFHHEHRFDEVITDFPTCSDVRKLSDIDRLYASFFKKIKLFLEADAVLILYTRNRDILRKYAINSDFRQTAEFEISRKEGSYLIILQKQ